MKLNCVFPLKVVVHLTDGIDAPYAELKTQVEELRVSGKKIIQYKLPFISILKPHQATIICIIEI